jgi:hypothetical protein
VPSAKLKRKIEEKSMPRIVLCLFVLLLLVTSLPAFAGSDGPTLITQSAVQKAGGFPYAITQPGSYKLSGNLTVPANTIGIDIQTNGVTLDLDGFSIVGAISCQGGTDNCTPVPTFNLTPGIFSRGLSNIIRNGHVRGFAYGVKTFGGLVEEISATENFFVGIEANNAVLRKNTASNNHLIGIQGFDCLVSENTLISNGGNQAVVAGGGVFSRNIVSSFLNNGPDISISVVNDHTSSCISSGNFGPC